jgi:DNA-binding MarR family transcriptional regulator
MGDATLCEHPAIEDPWEHMIYWAHVKSAEKGERANTVDEMCAHLGCSDGGTMTAIEQRMERKGWIVVERFQRWRRVTIVATGKKTKQAPNPVPHWRHRPEHQMEPVALLRLHHPEAFQEMLIQARRERRSLAAYLADFLAESWARRLEDG